MVNSGAMPNIDNAWDYIVKTESYKAYKGWFEKKLFFLIFLTLKKIETLESV